jgi:hypothetical protein
MNRAEMLGHVLELCEDFDPADLSNDTVAAIELLREERDAAVAADDDAAGVIMSAGRWRNNAELVVDVARLYLRDTDHVMDITYGRGKWWTILDPGHPERPGGFTRHDLDPAKGDGVDWGNLPDADHSVDVVAWDPNYVAVGGRGTTDAGIVDYHDRFGMRLTEATPMAQWANIRRGFPEVARVVRVGGFVWFKCMNYVTNGTIYWFTRMALDALEEHGFEIEAEFIHIGGTGPQPKKNRDGSERRQVHPRNNASRLIVARRLPDPEPELALGGV